MYNASTYLIHIKLKEFHTTWVPVPNMSSSAMG